MIKKAFAISLVFAVMAGSASAQQQPDDRQTTASDALSVVDACIRLNKASLAYLAAVARLQGNGDSFGLFKDIPTVKLLANIIDYHSTKTGFTSKDCMTFYVPVGVLDALQGHKVEVGTPRGNVGVPSEVSPVWEEYKQRFEAIQVLECIERYRDEHGLTDFLPQEALDACQ